MNAPFLAGSFASKVVMIVVRALSSSKRFLKPLGLVWLGVFACVAVHASETQWQSHAQPVFLSPLGNSPPIEGQVDTILEDQQGFIWLVAANGLWRWDSKSLVRARFEGADNEAPAPQVNHGFSDAKGRIWIGTSNGLYRQTPGTSSFTAVAPGQLQNITVQAGTVISLPHTDIVILASDRTLYQFDTASAQLKQLPIAPNARIHALHVSQANTLWVGTDKGLYRSDLNKTGLHHYKLHLAFLRVSGSVPLLPRQRKISWLAPLPKAYLYNLKRPVFATTHSHRMTAPGCLQ